MTRPRLPFAKVRSSLHFGPKKRHVPRRHRLLVERLEDRSLLAAGDLDTSFGPDGTGMTVHDPLPSFPEDIQRSVAIQSDGKIVTAWTTENPEGLPFPGVARYTVDGLPDDSFGGFGLTPSGFSVIGGILGEARDIAIQEWDDKIVVVGEVHELEEARGFLVARFNSDGSLDTDFGNYALVPGVSLIPFRGGERDAQEAVARGVVIQDDGRIVVAGTIENEVIALARLLPDGDFDNTFGSGGRVITNFDDEGHQSAEARDIAIQKDDGRIVVVGSARHTTGGFSVGKTTVSFAVARYETNGSLDTSFSGNGKFTSIAQEIPAIVSSNPSVGGSSVVIQPDGQIVVAGTAGNATLNPLNTKFAVMRLSAVDGSLDSSFGIGGSVWTDFPAPPPPAPGFPAPITQDVATSVALLPNGMIVVAGHSNFDFALARFDASGQLDASFGNNGLIKTEFADSAVASGLGIQPDGKIVAAGVAGDQLALARYDNSFIRRVGNFTADMRGPLISLLGTPAPDHLLVTHMGDGKYGFSTPDSRQRVTLSGIQRVHIQGLAGDDVVTIQRSPDYENDVDADDPVVPGDPLVGFDGGEDNDTLIARLALPTPPGFTPDPDPPRPGAHLQYEYKGGAGVDKLVVYGGPDAETCEVNGDVPDRSELDPHIIMDNQRTGDRFEIWSQEAENYLFEMGGGPDELFVHWDPEMFPEVGRLTANLGTGNDDFLVLFDQPFESPVRVGEPPLVIAVNGNDGDDSVGAIFDNPLLHKIFNPQPDPPGLELVLNAGRGNDDVSIDHRLPQFFAVSATVDAGDGNDSVLMNLEGLTPSETGLDASELPAFNGNVAVKLGPGSNQFQFHGAGVFETFAVSAIGGTGGDEFLSSFDETTVTESLISSVDGAGGANSAQWNVNGLSVNSQFVASYRGGTAMDQVSMALAGGEIGDDGVVAFNVAPGNGTNLTSVHVEGLTAHQGGRLTSTIGGGKDADEAGIAIIGSHFETGVSLSANMNLANGTNNGSVYVQDSMFDCRAEFSGGFGTGADEYGIVVVNNHVGPEGEIYSTTNWGNGTNRGLLQVEGLTVEAGGQATFNTQAGTGADEVQEIIDNGHVFGSLLIRTNLGNGTNRYNQRSESMFVEGTFETIVWGGTGRDDMAASFMGGEVAGTLSVRMTDSQGTNTLQAGVDAVLNGLLQLELTGGRNADLLSSSLHFDDRSRGSLLVRLRGGSGNDTLSSEMTGDEMLTLLAASILDGGLGTDTCVNRSRIRVVNCER